MAISRTRMSLSLLIGTLMGFLTALAATRSPAATAAISVTLRPLGEAGAQGAGFGTALVGTTSNLDVTLRAPSGWRIIRSQIRSSGSSFWAPPKGDPAPPTISQTYHAYGIGRNDDHSVAFSGKISRSGEGPGTPPDFDVAVADLQMAGHEIVSSDGSGLAIAPSMVSGQFPDTLPENLSPRTTTFMVTPRWQGPPNPTYVGQVTFTVSPGVAVYSAAGNLLLSGHDGASHHVPRYFPVPPTGLSGVEIKIVTNENFSGPGTITAKFTWDAALRAGSSYTAVDYVRVAPPTIRVRGVGFSGAGYNTMYKNGTDSYDPSNMAFADDGDTPVGWTLIWPPDSPLHGDTHRWHFLGIPDMFSGVDPACFTGGTTPHVAILAYVDTPHSIPTLRGRGEVEGTTPIVFMNGTTQDVPRGTSYHILEGDTSAAWTTTVSRGALTFDWYYDLNDRPTPNVQFYPSGSYPVYVTFGTPTGTAVTAKRVSWCTQLANAQDTPAKIGDAVGPDATGGSRFGSNSIFGSPASLTTAWQVMDGQRGDCGTLSTLMQYELDMLGATGSEVRFVYARHASWAGLSQPSPPYTSYMETDGSGHKLGIWFGGGLGQGWNNYEGCCVFQSKWWEGGNGTSQTSAYYVLRHVADPNTSGAGNSHQCWEHDTLTAVSYPPGTP